MEVTVIPIVIGVLRTIPKGFVKGQEDLEVIGQVETIQNTTLTSARILRKVLETWGDFLSLKLQWKTISERWSEKSLRNKIIIKRISHPVDFAVPADHRVNIKQSEKKAKKTLTLSENWKSCGTWGWRWLVHSKQSPRTWKRDWKSWESEDKSRPSRLQHC